MKLLNTNIFKLTLTLLLGVVTGFYTDLPLEFVFIIIGTTIIFFVIAFLRAKRLFFNDSLFGISCFILFFVTGIFTWNVHLPKNQKEHYINQISSENNIDPTVLRITIREVLKPDIFNNKFVAEVESMDNVPVQGKLLLLTPKETFNTNLNVGDSFLTTVTIKDIPAPLNPHQFDYRRFMANRGIVKQANLTPWSYRELPHESGLLRKTHFIRKTISENLRNNGFQPEELAIVQALLLGQKQDISKETYNSYAAAGAIHILAVSGLHVGLLLLLLNFLLSPLKKIKKGRFLRTFLVIILLWGFAILAGLSPSVVRAVTMFSFLAIGLELNRRTSSLNSLILSLLVLILIRPQWIFEVGFQLSYSAVLAILLIQPLLYKLFSPTNKPFRYLWGLLSTTFAAQLGVLPLSLFYFHQFPGLFFLSNLVILPFLGLILGIGILIILLSFADSIPVFLTEFYRTIIQSLNYFVRWVGGQEQFLFRDISFSQSEVWAFYLLLFCIIAMSYSFTFRKFIATLSAVIILQSVYIVKASDSSEESLIVYHTYGKSIIGREKNNKLLVHKSSDTSEISTLVKNYATGEGIKKFEILPLKNAYATRTGILLVIDSAGIYQKQRIKPEYLLLTGSPFINLERSIEELSPKMILADGNNFPSMVKRWKETCAKKEIPFHHTGEKGAFIIR